LVDTGLILAQKLKRDIGICGCHFKAGTLSSFDLNSLDAPNAKPPICTPAGLLKAHEKVDEDTSKMVSTEKHAGLTRGGALLSNPRVAIQRTAELAASETKVHVKEEYQEKLGGAKDACTADLQQLMAIIDFKDRQLKQAKGDVENAVREKIAAFTKAELLEECVEQFGADLDALGGTHAALVDRHEKNLLSISVEGKRAVHEQLLAHYRTAMIDLAAVAEQIELTGDVDRLNKRDYGGKQVHSVAGVKRICLAAEGVEHGQPATTSHTWAHVKAMLHEPHPPATSYKSTVTGWAYKENPIEKEFFQRAKVRRFELDGCAPDLAPGYFKREEEADRSKLNSQLRSILKKRSKSKVIVGPYLEKTKQQQSKEKRVVASFFQTLEASNQKVSFLQDANYRVSSGGMTHHGKSFSADIGTFGSVAKQKRMNKQDKLLYRKKVNAKVTGWCDKVKRGEKVNIQLWTDDFTRLTILQRFVAAADRSRNNYWTTIAAKATELIDHHQPRHIFDAAGNLVPHLNPNGFTASTIEDVLLSAGPGCESFFDYADRVLPAGHSGVSTEGSRQRIRIAHYSQADLGDKLRAMRGAQVLELAMHPFKSYGEFGRAMLVLISNPGLQELLEGGCIIFLVGDWPAATFQGCLARQGWNLGNAAPTRSESHAGRLLYQCCQDCTHSNLIGDHALWVKYMESIGLDPETQMEDGWQRAGSALRNIVTIIGPLHTMLNIVGDIGKHHRDTFIGRFYKCWVGVEMHATPKVRQVICCCEMLLSAWSEIRAHALPALESCAQLTGQRFDLTAFTFFFEHHLPLALLSYSIMLREAIDDPGPGVRPANPAPYGGQPPTWGIPPPQGPLPQQSTASSPGMMEARAWVQALKHMCVLAHVRQRKNYTGALLDHLDKLNYWQRVNHPAYHLLYNHPEFYDEMWGETGIHSVMRCCDFHADGAFARDQALGIFARRNGLDPLTLAMQNAYQRETKTKLKKLTERNIVEGKEVAIAFLNSIVQELLQAGKPGGCRLPQRFPKGVSTNFTYDLYECEALTGRGTPLRPALRLKGYLVGAPGFALNPDDLGRDGSDPIHATAMPNRCMQPGCSGLSNTAKWRHTCGHVLCDACLAHDKHCLLCRGTLREAMQFKAGWVRDFNLRKVIQPSRILQTKLGAGPNAVPLAAYGGAGGGAGGGGGGGGGGSGSGGGGALGRMYGSPGYYKAAVRLPSEIVQVNDCDVASGKTKVKGKTLSPLVDDPVFLDDDDDEASEDSALADDDEGEPDEGWVAMRMTAEQSAAVLLEITVEITANTVHKGATASTKTQALPCEIVVVDGPEQRSTTAPKGKTACLTCGTFHGTKKCRQKTRKVRGKSKK
jgi:hypothetical protein